MGGREQSGGRVRFPGLIPAISSAVATLEERTTAESQSESKERWRPGKALVNEGATTGCVHWSICSAKRAWRSRLLRPDGDIQEARSGAQGGPPLRGRFPTMLH